MPARALEGHSFWLQPCQRAAAKPGWYTLRTAQRRAPSTCEPFPPHVSMLRPLLLDLWRKEVWRHNRSPPQRGCARFSPGLGPQAPQIKACAPFTLHVKSTAGPEQSPGGHLWLWTAVMIGCDSSEVSRRGERVFVSFGSTTSRV